MRSPAVLAGLVVVVVSVPQTAGASSALPKPGAKVRVTRAPAEERNGKRTETVVGRLVELDAEGIAVLPKWKDEPVLVPRRAIVRLELSDGSTHGRNAAIGAGIGLAVGLGAALVEYARCKGEWLCETVFALPVLTAPAGALVGFVTGGDRWVDKTSVLPRVTVAPVPKGVQVSLSFSF